MKLAISAGEGERSGAILFSRLDALDHRLLLLLSDQVQLVQKQFVGKCHLLNCKDHAGVQENTPV